MGMGQTPLGVPHNRVHNTFREDIVRLVHMAEKLEAADQHVAFPKSGRGVCGQETGAEKMIEAIKYVLFAAGVVTTTLVIVFVACFGAWLFDKWRKER
jgi:hypothetical protein